MTRYLAAMFCIIFASISQAAMGGESPDGTIKMPGYDPGEAVYMHTHDYGDILASGMVPNAAVARVNPDIPQQMILICPENSSLGIVNESNVEQVCQSYLKSLSIVDDRFDLVPVSSEFVMGRTWFLTFQKYFQGVPVFDGGLKISLDSRGEVGFLMGRFGEAPADIPSYGISSDIAAGIALSGLEGSLVTNDYIGQALVPVYLDNRTEYHPVYRYELTLTEPYSEWVVDVDAKSGSILQRRSTAYYGQVSGNVSGSIQPLTPYDPWEDRDFYHQDVVFGIHGSVLTDMDGNYTITIPGNDPLDVESWMAGPFMHVHNSNGADAYIVQNIVPNGTYDVYWDDTNSDEPERCAWYSGVFIHNWIKTIDPDLTEMDFAMGCNVNVNGSCNAFWSGQSRTINFYREGGGCPNIAQIADVVYHEYGHGITDLQYRPFYPSGAMHEGFSDYIACTVTDQPHVGLGFNGPGTYLRNLDNNNRYPENWTGEPHNDGLIIGGALWHTREILSNYPQGYTDSLWHFAREAHPSNFEEYFWAFLSLDDDDGNINNGTPNAGTIFYTFGDLHGIGPGSVIIVTADSLYDTEDTTGFYEVTAEIMSPFSPLPDSVLLYYDAGNGFTPVVMSFSSGVWSGLIPAQSNGTIVNYYVFAVDEGGFRGSDPPEAPTEYYTFYVGPDLIQPEVSFLQGPPNTINLFGPYGPFTVYAWDVNGIDPTGVYLHYAVNYGTEIDAMMSPTGNEGEFELESIDIGYRLNSGDIVNYYFTVLDGANNPNTCRYPETGSMELLMDDEEVFEGFEEYGIDRWNVEGAWALFSQGHSSPQSMIFGPGYPNGADDFAYMDYGWDLSPYGEAFITVYHKNVILDGDTCFVLISNNGGVDWQTVGSITGYSGSSFAYGEFDITAALNIFAHDYRVGFRFVSDPDGSSIGVMLDDIGWRVGEMTAAGDDPLELPKELSLAQNYPNPFNPGTSISFDLPRKSDVKLEIFDLLGRKITEIAKGKMEAGEHTVFWNGTDNQGGSISSGIYFYRLVTDLGVRQAKMTLLK